MDLQIWHIHRVQNTESIESYKSMPVIEWVYLFSYIVQKKGQNRLFDQNSAIENS